MKNNTNALLKTKTPLSPSRHSIGATQQSAAIRIIDNSSNDTDSSEDLNPTPRNSPIYRILQEQEDFDLGDTYGQSDNKDDVDAENNDDKGRNVFKPVKIESKPIQKGRNSTSEDSIVFDSNPIAQLVTRDRVDDYRHRVAINKEQKRIELEKKRRKAEEARIAKIAIAREKRLKEEEEARIIAEKEAEEARLAKETADAIALALEETERQELKKREEELLAARIDRSEYDERDTPSVPLQYIHEKPPTPVKSTTPIITGVSSGIYTGLGIGLVASIVKKNSNENPDSKIEEENDDGENSASEYDPDDGAWHENYNELKQQISSISADDDEISVFEPIDDVDRKRLTEEDAARQAAEKQAAERQAAEEVERLAIKEKQRLEEEEEFKKRAKALEYQKKIEEKRQMKKKAVKIASMEAARTEAAERLASFERMTALRAAMKAEADRKRKEQEEEELKKRNMGLININKNIVNPLASALLAAIDFVDYKSKLDIAQMIAQKVETEVNNVVYGEPEKNDIVSKPINSETSKESIHKEPLIPDLTPKEDAEEEIKKEEVKKEEVQEEVKIEVKEEVNDKVNDEIKDEDITDEDILTPLPVATPEVPFAVDPAYSPEDVKKLSELYTILYSGFDVTKKSTKGQLQRRILYCDALMTNLSWKEPVNERKRADSVISMFGSKKSENERLLDFNLITNVTAAKKIVVISHPLRTLELTIEDEKIIEIVVAGLSVYAGNNPQLKNTASNPKVVSKRSTLPPSSKLASYSSSTVSTANSSPQSLQEALQ